MCGDECGIPAGDGRSKANMRPSVIAVGGEHEELFLFKRLTVSRDGMIRYVHPDARVLLTAASVEAIDVAAIVGFLPIPF